jgi:hypothetical protein
MVGNIRSSGPKCMEKYVPPAPKPNPLMVFLIVLIVLLTLQSWLKSASPVKRKAEEIVILEDKEPCDEQSCAACTFLNSVDAIVCAMCESKLPRSSPKRSRDL